MNFAKENDLLYIGESSALADINIKEVVETLMERIFETQTKESERKLVESQKLQKKFTDPSLNKSSNACC